MKNVLGRKWVLLIVSFLSIWVSVLNPVRAEYNGHYIDYKIELKNGNTIDAHTYLSDLEYLVDSGTYKNYLEKRIAVLLGGPFYEVEEGDEEEEVVFVYYEHRLTYTYQVPKYPPGVIFTLANKQVISLEEIQRVEILEMIDFPYTEIVVNPLTIRDEKWMKKMPVRFWGIGDGLNFFKVFIHEKNKKLDQVLLEIEMESALFEEKVESLELEIKGMYGSSSQEFEEQISRLIEGRSYQVSDALSRLFAFKVVIIGYLSC